MELGSIKKIVETEREAENMKQSAKEKAEAIVKKAIDSKEQKEFFAKNRIDEKKRQLEEKSKMENADRIRQIDEMTKEECKKIELKSAERMQEAVNAIFKEVIG